VIIHAISPACCAASVLYTLCWGSGESYIVEDVEIRVQGIAASCVGAIVGDLDGVVESVQVDAVK
jgi:hypothetical protein